MRRVLLSVSCSPLLLLAACGDEPATKTQSSELASTTVSSAVPATLPSIEPGVTPSVKALEKPEVKLPSSLPTKLEITDLKPGAGPKAAAGDTVVVHYVGVRSKDGKEFDNSYDRGEPFPVSLGAGSVIKGWDDGLVGAQKGMRRQLDIPAALAYGDQAKSDVIEANTDLTFVIDVVGVIGKADPAKAPTEKPRASTGATKLLVEDVTAGAGEPAKAGQTVFANIIAYRGDTMAELDNSWKNGTPISLKLDAQSVDPGLIEAFVGMKVGGRRYVTIPSKSVFNGAGNESLGLPAGVDFVLVVDLVEAY